MTKLLALQEFARHCFCQFDVETFMFFVAKFTREPIAKILEFLSYVSTFILDFHMIQTLIPVVQTKIVLDRLF